MANDSSAPGGGKPSGRGGEAPVSLRGIILLGTYLVGLTAYTGWRLQQQLPSCDLPVLSADAIRPTTVSTAGGERLQIIGDGFEPGLRVRIGDVPAPHVDVESRTTVSVVTPPHAAGSVVVAVTQDGSEATVPSQLVYATAPTPTSVVSPQPNPQASAQTGEAPEGQGKPRPAESLSAEAIMPSKVSIVGGEPVTILGTGFREGVAVLFDGIPARAVRVDGARRLSATTPRHPRGSVEVVLVDDAAIARLSATLTYACPPISEGRMFWLVMLAGFLGALVHALRSFYWYVGSRELVWSWTAMYLLLPFTGSALAFVFFLIVQAGLYTPQGEASLLLVGVAALVGMFSAQAAEKLKDIADGLFSKAPTGKNHASSEPTTPAISSVHPSSGPLAGGTRVVITGDGFVKGTAVRFDSIPATSVEVEHRNTLHVVTPPRAKAGRVDVTVAVPRNAPVTDPGGFTYKAPTGKVTGVTPDHRSTDGGEEVTLSGEGFPATAQVSFGETPARDVRVVDATTLTATTPKHSPGAVDIRVDSGDDLVGVLSDAFEFKK